jgi:hypothetical protein
VRLTSAQPPKRCGRSSSCSMRANKCFGRG